tara:strand:+ start:11739 stop:12359 length:621 start_codon:yes stop_codon:yes gene_type:complete
VILKNKAIVIKSFPYGDTSLISRLILNDGNKISLLIKGATSMKSNKGALFQPLNLIDIDYYHKDNRAIQIYKEGTLINGFMDLRKSFDCIKYSLCMIDIIDKTLAKHSNESIIFNLLYDSLNRLDNNNKKIVFIYFLLLYTHYSGYSITKINYQNNSIDFANNFKYNNLEELIKNYDHNYIIKEIIYTIGLNINEIKNVKSLKFIN